MTHKLEDDPASNVNINIRKKHAQRQIETDERVINHDIVEQPKMIRVNSSSGSSSMSDGQVIFGEK